MKQWTPQETRDEVVGFVRKYSPKTEIARKSLISSIGVSRDRFYDWSRRLGKANQHNAESPRDFWLQEWEKVAILNYFDQHQEEGHRRLAYMMCDENIAFVSPSSIYRVLKSNALIEVRQPVDSKKGTGFNQPSKPHKHWHIDVSYLNICGTFYYFCGVLDGFSRHLLHWEIRESMKESEIEIILQRAREIYSHAKPRIISDNGPQFISRDFKEFIRISGMTHVRTSPYYPQSNGKIERFHQSLKRECIRPRTPVSLDDARKVVAGYVDYYNNVRLHSAIDYITPKDKLEGHAEAIKAERKNKVALARQQRKEFAHAQKLAEQQLEVDLNLTSVAV